MNDHLNGQATWQIDRSAALAALAGNESLLQDLAEMFAEDAPHLLNEATIAVDEQDSERARRSLHSLKGLVSTFFASQAARTAERLEDEAARENFSTLADGGLEKMREHVDQLLQEMKQRKLLESG